MLTVLEPDNLKEFINKNLEDIKKFSLLKDHRIGWCYSLDYSFIAKEFERLDSLGLIHKNLKIVDIGCGPGAIHGYLENKYGVKIVGVDKQRWAKDYVNCWGDFLNDNFRRNHKLKNFDIIISSSAFEHLVPRNHEKIIQLCKKLLNKNGHLIVTASISENNRETKSQTNLNRIELEKIYDDKFKDYDYNKSVKKWEQDKSLMETYRKNKPGAGNLKFLSFGYTYHNVDVFKNIVSYKNYYKGKRCFVLGNGPSLANTNLDLLVNDYTFALNKISLIYEKTKWRPTFFVSFTDHVTKNHGDWFDWTKKTIDLGIPSFLNAAYKKKKQLVNMNNTFFTKCTGSMTKQWNDNHWSDDCTKLITKWGTTLMCSLQLAVYMGFNPIYLIGCDLDFNDQDDLTNDTNHFDKRYFVPNKKASMYNHNMISAHKFMKTIFEKREIKVYNATIGGSLEEYERVDYESLFK